MLLFGKSRLCLGMQKIAVIPVITETRPLIECVRPGDRVTIITPQGQERTGRAVMPCSAGGWVLNMGGRHGTPGIAGESNTVRVKPARK
jgi:hypothetical protein